MAIFIPTNSDTGYYNYATTTTDTLVFELPRIYLVGPYYFDASDAGPTDVSSVWTNDANAFDGDLTGTWASNTSNGLLKGTGTNAPASGIALAGLQFKARLSSDSGSDLQPGTWADVDEPSGGWTWAKLQAIHLEYDIFSDAQETVKIYESDGGTLLCTLLTGNTQPDLTNFAGVEIAVYEVKSTDYYLFMLVGDDDVETWQNPGPSPFTEFFQVNNADGDDASIAAFYAPASFLNSATARWVRTGAEESVGVVLLIRGVDRPSIEDVAFVEGTHFVSTENVDGTPNITPQPITTVTDDAVVIILTGNRSSQPHLGITSSNWDVIPPSGYTIESGAASAETNTQGAPGRLEQGTGAGDAQMTWMWKEVATAATETPADITGFSGGRDMKTVTFAIRSDPSLDQTGFRFRNDDGSETAATWMADLNTDVEIDAADSNADFRLRIQVTNQTGRDIVSTMNWHPQFSLNGGTWFNVGDNADTGIAVRAQETSNMANNDPTTEQLAGAGVFIAGVVKDDFTEIANFGHTENRDTEHEFMLELLSSELVDTDTIDFRLVRDASSEFNTYTQIPRITISAAGGTTETATDDADVTDATPHVLTIIRSVTDAVGVVDQRAAVTPFAEVALKTTGDPLSTFHEITVRHQGDGQSGDATVKLMEGSTQVARFGLTVVDGVWNATSYELSVGEANSITDYTDLRIRVEENPLSSVPWLRISWMEMVLSAGGDQTKTVTEATGVTDDTVRVIEFVRTVTDAAGVIDATPHALTIARSVTDDVDVTDDTISAVTITIEIVEAVGATDDTLRVAPAVRVVTDAVGLIDATTQAEENAEASVEAVGVTDDTSRIHDAERVSTEPVAVSDDTLFAVIISTEVVESVGVTDATLRVAPTVRVVTESVDAIDAATQAEENVEASIEAVGVTDATTYALVAVRALTEPVGVTDLATPVKAIAVEIVEAVGVTDLATPVKAIAVEIVEAVGVEDATLRVAPSVRVITESVDAIDAATQAEENVEASVEAVAVTDVVSRVAPAERTSTEPVGATDAVTRAVLIARSVTEPVGATDDASAQKAAFQLITEAVGVTDLAAPDASVDYDRTITDDVGAIDAATRVVPAVRVVIEAVGVTDGVSAPKTIAHLITEPVGVTDLATPVKLITVEIVEAIGVTDQTVRIVPFIRTATEPVGVIDATTQEEENAEASVEPVAVTDATARVHDAIRVSTEPVGVTDDTTTVLSIIQTITEAIAVTDATSRAHDAERTSTETVAVTDTTARIAPAIRAVTDPVGVIDAATQLEENAEASVEAVAISDVTTRVHDAIRVSTEPVDVTDTTLSAKTIVLLITETVGVTDIAIDAVLRFKARPVSDVASAFWDTAPVASEELWEQLDEVIASDTDYIFALTP